MVNGTEGIMKKILAFLLVLSMMVLFASCAAKPEAETPPIPEEEPNTEPQPEPIPEPDPKIVGISMPTEDLQRWNSDGHLMEKLLTEAGYEAQLQFAANDPAMQISQIEQMIKAGAKVLVVTAIDGEALGTVLKQAKEADCKVIAYDRLVIGSDAVNYYLTFDNYQVGILQGKFIEEQLDLPNAGDRTYNIEFLAGDSGDSNMYILIDGAFQILDPYINAGTLIIPSGQYDKMDIATEGWNAAKAQERFEELLENYYYDKNLDAVVANNDSLAQGVASALEISYHNEVYPIITGMDCDYFSVRNILEGKQAMSLIKLSGDLASKAVDMCIAILNGNEPEINDNKTYDNGTGIIPSYLCPPRVCTADNYRELLLDSGYYSEEEWEEITSYITGPAGTAQVEQYVKYQVKDDHIILTGLSDEGKRQKTIELPSTIDGKPVTEIKAEAFQNSTALTGISIPESITSIGANAFSSCIHINHIIIPESVKYIGNNAFSNCKNLTDISIPEGVTSINGFNNCTSLRTITIPKGVTSIKGFNDCASLRSITIPEGLTSIEGFDHCTSLTEITFPKDMDQIDGFNYCDGLKSITFSGSVTEINGFDDCNSLISVTFPEGLTRIEGFRHCTSLDSVIFPKSVSYIDGFYGCSNLTKVMLPNDSCTLQSHTFEN